MEKEKSQIISNIIFIFSSIAIAVILLTQVLYKVLNSSTPNFTVIYWFILFAWISLIHKKKFTSMFSLLIAFYLFIAGSILSVLGYVNIAETVMKLSFIGLVIGVIEAFLENMNKDDKKST